MMENEFEVTVRQTLAKTTSVFTEAVHQCVERDYDAMAGSYAYTSFAEPDCDLSELFAEQQRSALEIIRDCEKIAHQLIKDGKLSYAGVSLNRLLDSCAGWEETELNVE